MKAREVVDEYGRSVVIDEDSRKLYSYSNKKKSITYSAMMLESGKPSGFWTNYKEHGTVDSIPERLKMWNNVIKLAYADAVDFSAPENDPDGKKWEKVVKYVTDHEDEIFTQEGDFRKTFLIDPSKIENIFSDEQ